MVGLLPRGRSHSSRGTVNDRDPHQGPSLAVKGRAFSCLIFSLRYNKVVINTKLNMNKNIFGLIIISSLIFMPLLVLAEPVSEEEVVEEDEFIEMSIGGADLSAGADCFDYYHFNSVEIEFDLANTILIPGETLNIEGVLRNHNDYPLVDGGLFVQVFREKKGGNIQAGNYLIDEFWAVEEVALNALGEKNIGFDWSVPAGLSSGDYLLVGHFLIGTKMNLSGLSFVEGIYGGLSRFTVEEQAVNEIYFDKESIEVNDQAFLARSFVPQLDQDQADISFDLINLGDQSREINLDESLYQWDNLGRDQLIWSDQRTLSLTPGGRRSANQVFSDLSAGVYLYEAKTDQSILKARFVVSGSDSPSRFNFLALSDFPIKKGQDNSFFACFHNTIDSEGVEGRVEVRLEDAIGNEIAAWDYEGLITPNIMAGVSDFKAQRDYNQVWLKGSLYQADELIDEVSLLYDVEFFSDPADLNLQIESGQLSIQATDLAGRSVNSRMMVEIRDQEGSLIYLNPNYYGDDLRGEVDFVAGQNYQIEVLSGGQRYEFEYLYQPGSGAWFWLVLIVLLLILTLILYRRRKSPDMTQKTMMLMLVFLLIAGFTLPLLTEASTQQSFFDRIWQQLTGRQMSLSEYNRGPIFTVSQVRTGAISVDTRSASKKNLEFLRARTAVCNNRRIATNNPCEDIYDSGFLSGQRQFARHLGLQARINFSTNYPVNLVDVATGEHKTGGDMVNLGDVLRVELGEPEGEWYFTGSAWDTPPIAWLGDAEKAYQEVTAIPQDYLTNYQINVRSAFGLGFDNILNPKVGAAATNPLTVDQVQVSVTEEFNTYQEGGQHYVEVVGLGIGEIEVEVPASFAYATIDNYWFEAGTVPASIRTTAIGVVAEQETLSVSLSADPASGNAPLAIDLTASINPDSTAVGPADYTFWCDCDYAGVDIEGTVSQCGAWIHRVVEQDIDSYTATDVCTYGSAGDYTPKVIVERGLAEAAQAQVADLRVFEVQGSQPRVEDLSMDPENCTNDCHSCAYPLQPTLYWRFVSDEGYAQSAFEIHFANNAAFNNYINVTEGWVDSLSEAYAVGEDSLSYGQTYWWRIRVRDSQGVSSDWATYENTYQTIAHPYPEPDFTWEPEPPVLEEETEFTDTSKIYGGGSASYQWTFPEAQLPGGTIQDPLILTDRHPTVIFTGLPTQRSVEMIITDAAGLYCDTTKLVPTSGSFGLPDYEEVAP